jgi:hypothetical protein
LEAVEAHDEALDLAALAEELVDLLLGGVEGEVADVEGAGVLELVFGLRGGFAVERLVVAAAFASALLVNSQYMLDHLCVCEVVHTFAVAYELGLSRRSTVLRRAGMASVSPQRCVSV